MGGLTIKHNFKTLMRRLSDAGFSASFVRSAILPDWWEDGYSGNPELLSDFEIRIARFLGLSLTDVRNPELKLHSPRYPGAQLRRVRDIDRDRLSPSIHAALRIGGAISRNFTEEFPEPVPLPKDGKVWREHLIQTYGNIAFQNIVTDLWLRGIPVVPLANLPSPIFQGLACILGSRPMIMIGHKIQMPSRVAFVTAHEAGHISAGDCTPDSPIVDEDEENPDDSPMERGADKYAIDLLTGGQEVPLISHSGFKDLAQKAVNLEKNTGIDAVFAIFSNAKRTREYAIANQAVNALHRGHGARRILIKQFEKHIVMDSSSDSDHALLQSVIGDPDE